MSARIALTAVAMFQILLFSPGGIDVAAGQDSPAGVLDKLRAGHPRIIASDETWRRVKAHVESDPRARAILDHLHASAVSLIDEPPMEHKLIGPRLLQESRKCLERVYILATVYRVTGEKRFAERAKKEMLAAAAFPDWNPSHFLDTAEMAHALAIGYDWLFDTLSDTERTAIREAIVEKGLKPSLPLYETDEWQVASSHNWNQVCNGGLAIAALAVADEEPELAAHVIQNAVRLLPKAMASYAPDGGWPEGPAYWRYATRYNVLVIAALETALGEDFGLSEMPGFSETGLFPIHFSGPTGRTFNYADGSDFSRPAAIMFYLAERLGKPVLAGFQHRMMKEPTALDLLWYTPEGQTSAEAGVPLDKYYGGIEVAFLRSAWDDPDAIFVGFKGGDNRANHSHLDLGTFVLDALGKRWAVDLGPDDYNLPGYWDTGDEGERYTYFRLSTQSHNTFTFAGHNQRYNAAAPIVAFGSSRKRSWAVADLSEGYAEWAASARRGIALLDRKAVLVQDEIDSESDEEIVWRMLTPAAVETDGDSAVLSLGDARMEARIVGGDGLEFSTAPAAAPQPQKEQKDVTILQIRIPGAKGKHTLAVLFTPYGKDGEAATIQVEVTPLDQW